MSENINLYVTAENERFFYNSIRPFYMKSVLAVECVDRGVIVSDTKTGAYGVLDSRGRFVASSRCLRENKGQFIPKMPSGDIPYYDCDAVFCGSCIGHFGHFLLEGMNRSYLALDAKYSAARMVFVVRGRATPPRYILPLMDGLNVKSDRLMFLTGAARFRRVFVPAQAFNIPLWSSNEMGDTYRAISKHYGATDAGMGDKIYVSRGAMPERRTYGENQIERIFAKNGFKIIYPETLPLPKQIAIMSHCKTLAGCAGTALHLALFMPRGGHVIQIKRNSRLKDSADNQNMINQTVGLDFTYISGSIEDTPTDHFTDCPQIIGVTDQMRKFLDDNGFVYDDADIAPNNDEIVAYRAALSEYQHTHGGAGMIKVKKKFIKYISCLIPGRINRNHARTWLQKKLGLK
ncbi:MAG: glycosyltransferase family 61 protein [Muribaculaceae bacterium]|nr:glycosyltransferase family 61 protein [Muribaculaceae bacterium]